MVDSKVDVRVVLSTCPDREAQRIAYGLVEDGIAACVNIAPKLTSVYRWEGAIHEDKESLLLIKTTADRLNDLRKALLTSHPYDVPEVLVLDVDAEASNPIYVDWVRECVKL